jgi:hypothetical protein
LGFLAIISFRLSKLSAYLLILNSFSVAFNISINLLYSKSKDKL